MTPELKTACELVFQEHKGSAQPIKWGRDAFRGRISIGLSEMAKETLVQKNIIVLPDKSKKVFTLLNPDVAEANSFEEAERMIVTMGQGLVMKPAYDPEAYLTNHVYGFAARPSAPARKPQPVAATPAIVRLPRSKWWLKPVWLYFVWPVFGAAAGVLLSFLMNFFFSELFSHAR